MMCKDTPLLKHCIPLSGYAKLTEYAQEAKAFRTDTTKLKRDKTEKLSESM